MSAAPPAPGPAPERLRLAVHTDQAYRRDAGGITTARSFVDFVGEVGRSFADVTIVGRLDPRPGRDAHPLPAGARFVALPWYAAATSPAAVLRAVGGSLRTMWHVLGRADVVWLMGPSPLTLPFAALAALRRTPVVLGIRQDLPAYTRARHPGRRALHRVADALDGAARLLARRVGVVAVGPVIAGNYRGARALHETSVSLVRGDGIVDRDHVRGRGWSGPLDVLTVGRLDAEKNPLLLADVLAGLPDRWRLTVCGDGPLQDSLAARVAALGLEDRVTLCGYLTDADGLRDRYRDSHAFLHVSLTEGVPQVLFEAFGAGLPVVATDVGGVGRAVGDAALLIPPADAGAAVDALQRLADDDGLRHALADRGREAILGRTLEREARAVAEFLAAQAARPVSR